MAIEPISAALIGVPMLLNFIGGLLDTMPEEQLGLSKEALGFQKEKWEEQLPLMKGSQALQAGGYLSNLLGQQKGTLGDIGTGAGFGAAAGFPQM